MRIPRLIEEELARIPGRWKLEHGGGHAHILVDGRLAAILPLGGGNEKDRRSMLNARAQIRRTAAGGEP